MIQHLAVLALLLAAPVRAEDREFLQALDAAQRARPAEISSTSRIAPEREPGTALVVHGRVFAADGKTPLAGAIVFAYHTDREGLYDKPGAKPHSWRLKGWAKSSADGRFEFRTIRPGSYPKSSNPAHIHLSLFTADGSRYHAGEVLFADDPLVGEFQREATRRDPTFGSIRPVRLEKDVQHVDLNMRIVPDKKF